MSSTNGNGAAAPVKPTNGVKTTVEIKPAPKTTSLAVVPKEAPDLQPLEDRLHRLNVLFDLQRKHTKLLESKTKLQQFETASNKEDSELTISDDEGNEFTTSNPAVIIEVKKLILNTVNKMLADTAAQIVL